MKDIVTPVPQEEVRSVIKKCLEKAALVNYTRVSEYAKIEGTFCTFPDPHLPSPRSHNKNNSFEIFRS